MTFKLRNDQGQVQAESDLFHPSHSLASLFITSTNPVWYLHGPAD